VAISIPSAQQEASGLIATRARGRKGTRATAKARDTAAEAAWKLARLSRAQNRHRPAFPGSRDILPRRREELGLSRILPFTRERGVASLGSNSRPIRNWGVERQEVYFPGAATG
jgi:hypothetical protein